MAGSAKRVGQVAFAVARVAELLRQRRQVVLAVGVDDVGDELAALPHEERAAAQQVARGALGARVDVGQRESAAAQERGDLPGVDLVVLGLAAVDGLHVEGVAQREGDGVVFAKVGEPVPGEHALAADDQAGAIRRDGVEKGLRLGGQVALQDGLAVRVEHVGVQASGMEIDAAVECVGGVVEAHA